MRFNNYFAIQMRETELSRHWISKKSTFKCTNRGELINHHEIENRSSV